jgi:hypothetical protein
LGIGFRNRPLAKLHLLIKMPLFGIFSKQSEFHKRSTIKKILVVFLCATKALFSEQAEDLEAWLASFSTERIEIIQNAITESLEELSGNYKIDPKRAFCIYSLGSLSSSIAIPQSDFEFGILVNSSIEKSFFDAFIPSLRDKLALVGIRFDNHQMFPKFYENGKAFGFSHLCTSSEDLIDLLDIGGLSFCYILYFTKYIYGNASLYEKFTVARSTTKTSKERAFIAEIRKTMQRVYEASCLYKSWGSKESLSVDFKKELFRLVVDCVNYLSFFYDVAFTTPFEEIRELVEREVLLPDEGERVRAALLFALEERIAYKDERVSLDLLEEEEAARLCAAWETLAMLGEKTSQNFMTFRSTRRR